MFKWIIAFTLPVFLVLVVLVAMMPPVGGLHTGEMLAAVSVSDRNAYEIMLVDLDTGVNLPIIPPVNSVKEMLIAPDGRHALIASGANDIRLHLLELTTAQMLYTSPDRYDIGPLENSIRWSPDGRYALFNSSEAFQGLQLNSLYVMDTHSYDTRLLRNNVIPGPWSPQGDRVALVRDSSLITLLDIATEATTELNVDAALARDLHWSPDGTQLAFVGVVDNTSGLYVISIGDDEPHYLSPGLSHIVQPTWSPDGAWLSFLAGTLAERQAYTVEMTSGTVYHLDSTGTSESPSVRGVAWAPDGGRVALMARRTEWSPQRGVIYLADPRGEQVDLFTTRGVLPVWSPAGDWLLHQSWERIEGRYTGQFYLTDLGDAEHESMALMMGDGWQPIWSEEGRYLTYIQRNGEESRLVMVYPERNGTERWLSGPDDYILSYQVFNP